jgi:RHS repeat-associated protein
MTGYTFTVNSQTDVGALTWNANGTLGKMQITDAITGTTDSQTCNYLYDDLQRLSTANCGALWAQNFSYDSFGNITKTGSSAFIPSYSPTQNQFTLTGRTVSYDGNGNLLTDNLNTYTWDVYGEMSTVNTGSATVTATYDGLGRMVENNAGGTYTQIVYGPTGTKVATANAGALIKAFVALPGGAKAIYNSSGTLAYFRHSDWLGSSRLTSTAARPTSMYSSTAYAPFGESQASQTSGAVDASFTGQDQDTVGSLYDFTFRRYSQSQGRWISPDPLGVGAVDPTNPQTWNRYAYVANNPLSYVDPLGLEDCFCILYWDDGSDGGGGGGGDGSSGGGTDPGTPCCTVPGTTITVDGGDGWQICYGSCLGGDGPPVVGGGGGGGGSSAANNGTTPSQQQCLATVQGAVNSDLGTQSNYLGPTQGMDSNGMRGGAYNFDFFAPGVNIQAPGVLPSCGRFGDGLHVPIPSGPCNLSGDPTIPGWGPGIYNGMQGSFLTAHIDSSNPFQDLYSFFAHLINNVILQKKHGC